MGLLIAVTVPVLLGVLSSVIAGDRVCRWFCGLCLLLLLWPLSAITALEFVCSYCWDLCMQLLLGPVSAVTAVVLSVVIAGDWVYSWLLLLWLLSAITALEFVCRYCWVCEVFLQLLLWLMSVVTLLWRMSAVTAGIFCTGSFGPFFLQLQLVVWLLARGWKHSYLLFLFHNNIIACLVRYLLRRNRPWNCTVSTDSAIV